MNAILSDFYFIEKYSKFSLKLTLAPMYCSDVLITSNINTTKHTLEITN